MPNSSGSEGMNVDLILTISGKLLGVVGKAAVREGRAGCANIIGENVSLTGYGEGRVGRGGMVPGVSGLKIDCEATEGLNLELMLRVLGPALLGLGGTGADTTGGLGGALGW